MTTFCSYLPLPTCPYIPFQPAGVSPQFTGGPGGPESPEVKSIPIS